MVSVTTIDGLGFLGLMPVSRTVVKGDQPVKRAPAPAPAPVSRVLVQKSVGRALIQPAAAPAPVVKKPVSPLQAAVQSLSAPSQPGSAPAVAAQGADIPTGGSGGPLADTALCLLSPFTCPLLNGQPSPPVPGLPKTQPAPPAPPAPSGGGTGPLIPGFPSFPPPGPAPAPAPAAESGPSTSTILLLAGVAAAVVFAASKHPTVRKHARAFT